MFLYPKISPELESYEELNFSVYNYNIKWGSAMVWHLITPKLCWNLITNDMVLRGGWAFKRYLGGGTSTPMKGLMRMDKFSQEWITYKPSIPPHPPPTCTCFPSAFHHVLMQGIPHQMQLPSLRLPRLQTYEPSTHLFSLSYPVSGILV